MGAGRVINWEDNPCFICGAHNAVGLHVHFTTQVESGRMHAVLQVDDTWQGFKGVVHGGVVAGLLDDAMWHALFDAHQMVSMTAELTVRYKHPVRINTRLDIYGSLTDFHRRAAHAEAWIESEGRVLVKAAGIFMPAKGFEA
jgi:uncharacterized protein (TIGR00369 family)